MKKLLFFFCSIFLSIHCFSQNAKPKPTLKDTLDGKFDFSSFLSEANGFIPVPQLITEPALGGIGFLLAPVFIQTNKKPYPDRYTPPTITAIAGMVTGNKSWMTALTRSGAITKHNLKYQLTAGYGSINLDLYREIPLLGEQKFDFNFKTLPIYGNLLKKLGNSDFYAGFQYLFLSTEVSPKFLRNGENLPAFIQEGSLKTTQSSPGVIIRLDKRDNIFTPDYGTFFHVDFRLNAEWTGADFQNQSLRAYILHYFLLKENWVSGFRVETQHQFGEVPFFLESGINLRGVPAARYQGTSTYLLETEQRYDFSLRWSGIAFGGVAKALPQNQSFKEGPWVHNYGLGVRYLLARLFKLRMGVDLAWSNEDFGYYIVFASAWR